MKKEQKQKFIEMVQKCVDEWKDRERKIEKLAVINDNKLKELNAKNGALHDLITSYFVDVETFKTNKAKIEKARNEQGPIEEALKIEGIMQKKLSQLFNRSAEILAYQIESLLIEAQNKKDFDDMMKILHWEQKNFDVVYAYANWEHSQIGFVIGEGDYGNESIKIYNNIIDFDYWSEKKKVFKPYTSERLGEQLKINVDRIKDNLQQINNMFALSYEEVQTLIVENIKLAKKQKAEVEDLNKRHETEKKENDKLNVWSWIKERI